MWRIGYGVSGADPWEWEVWVDGGVVVLNMTRPGSGLYEVCSGMTKDQADRLGRALATAVGRLLHDERKGD